jgi:NAD(P)-dependent dehydrogenase (short-subunit alcohol dehydrogenase family)
VCGGEELQMNGKAVLVTGATDGVGRVVATALGKPGVKVLVHGRDATRAGEVVAGIRGAGGAAEFYPADFSSLAEVHALAAEVGKDHPHLDLLVNNAGIGSRSGGGGRRTSRDGHELRFAVNYLAGFVLTHLLLPRLRAGPRARIVNVASAGQARIDFDDVMLTRGYDGGRAYGQSKLAQIMFTFDLAEALRGSGVTVNALHPATYMPTTMVREAGVKPMSTLEEGATAILKLARAPELEGRSGLYFEGTREARADAQAYDASARARLGALSRALTGLPAS